MEISVIIPTYGKPVYLKEAINSVINQSFKDWELIVVDDNDPNSEARLETADLLTHFMDKDCRIKYLCHPQNLNGAVARNTGIKAAQGQYISFLDSDDEYLPDRLLKCYKAMEGKTEKTACIYTGCEFRRSRKKYSEYVDVKEGQFLLEALACTFRLGTGSNIFVRKSVVDELLGFDERFLRHQDSEFICRVFEKYAIAAIPEILVIKNNENFNLPNIEKIIDVKKLYLDKFKSQINEFSSNDKKYIYHCHYIQIAELAIRSGRKEIAKHYYTLAKKNGGLSFNENLRKIIFTIQNLCKR